MAGLSSVLRSFPEWESDAQMHALYCSYDSHPYFFLRSEEFILSFWQRAITALSAKGQLALSVEELLVAADRKGLKPVGLPSAIVPNTQAELVRRGELRWEDDLNSELYYHTHNTWTNWLWRKVGSGRNTDHAVCFHRKALTTCANELLQWVKTTQKSSVVPEAVLLQHFEELGMTEKDLKLVLCSLQLSDNVSLHNLTIGRKTLNVVKVKTSSASALEVNERDLAFLTVSTVREELEEYIKKTEEKRINVHAEIVVALKGKMKSRALDLLKREKMIDNLLQGLYQKSVNVEAVVMGLIEADTNLTTFTALKAATDSQRNSSLSLSAVEQLRDEIDSQKQYSDELSSVLAPRDLPEEELLEQELADLEAESLPPLPEVPTAPLPQQEKRRTMVEL